MLYEKPPHKAEPNVIRKDKLKLGVIGYGSRMRQMQEVFDTLHATQVTAIADIRPDEIRQKLRNESNTADDIAFYTDADEMLDSEELDGVMVGTRGYLHPEMGAKVLARNLPLYLEKPLTTTFDGLLDLKRSGETSKSPVLVAFPLRAAPIVHLVREIIDSGKIGTVEDVQYVNNVPYGGVYYHDWYRDEALDGGVWLAKATHDFDCINCLLGDQIQPRWICAMESKQVFKGNHRARLTCFECDELLTCMESPYSLYTRTGDIDGEDFTYGDWSSYYCSFAEDTGNHDSGSALIEYDGGMHVSYSQNFYARKAAARRGATLIGYKGSIEFDFYTGEVKVSMHSTPRTETYHVGDVGTGVSFGGDFVLALNFIDIMDGKCGSVAPLSTGLISTLTCLKARESAATREFKEITFPD